MKMSSINIFAHFWTVRAFLPSNDYGYIVNIALVHLTIDNIDA